jgi:hypothetical protein
MRYLIAIFLLITGTARAQDLPEKPQPRTADAHFWLEVGAMGAAWTMDTVSTHQLWQRCTGCIEDGGFFNGERSTAKSQAAWGGIDVAALMLGYEWKKHVHNRYLHPLWRVPMLYRSEAHAQAAIGNWTLDLHNGSR